MALSSKIKIVCVCVENSDILKELGNKVFLEFYSISEHFFSIATILVLP